MFKKIASISILLLWAYGSTWAQIEAPLNLGYESQPFWIGVNYQLDKDSYPIQKLRNSKCFGCSAYSTRFGLHLFTDSLDYDKRKRDTLFTLVKHDKRKSKTYVTLDWNFNRNFDDDTTYELSKDRSYILSAQGIENDKGKITYMTRYYRLSQRIYEGKLSVGLEDRNYYNSTVQIGKDTLYFQVTALYPHYQKFAQIGFGKTTATKLGWDEYFYDSNEILINGMAYRVNVDFPGLKLKLTKLNKTEASGNYEGYTFPTGDFAFFDKSKSSAKELLGKYTLLHTWGWWCGPCHVDFPKLKKLNDKYQDKLNMIGLHNSSTDDLARFKEDISKYQLTWRHINEFLTKNNVRSLDWIDRLNIGFYPTYIIIGPDGLIKLRVNDIKNFHKVEEFLEKVLKE